MPLLEENNVFIVLPKLFIELLIDRRMQFLGKSQDKGNHTLSKSMRDAKSLTVTS